MKKQLTIFLTIFISVTAIGYFILTMKKDKTEYLEPEKTTISQEFEKREEKDTLEITADVKSVKEEKRQIVEDEISVTSQNTLTANLKDVTGGTSAGQGSIIRDGENILHMVLANLPDPKGSNKYEGWLVNQSPTLSFISTGVLQKNNNGEYALVFTDQKPYEDYNFVVITEETVIDETPEVHIIEGQAK